jgi:phage shock protein C
MVAGVCGGLGAYFAIDPVIVRLAFVVVTLAGGAGLLAYIVLAIVVPEEPVAGALTPPPDGLRAERNRALAGLLLLAVGLLLLASNLGWLRWVGWVNWGLIWPLILIAIGIAILWRRVHASA